MSRLAYAAVFAAASTLLASGASANTVNFQQTTGNLYGGVGPVGVSVSNPVGGGSISDNVGGFRVTDTNTGTNFIA